MTLAVSVNTGFRRRKSHGSKPSAATDAETVSPSHDAMEPSAPLSPPRSSIISSISSSAEPWMSPYPTSSRPQTSMTSSSTPATPPERSSSVEKNRERTLFCAVASSGASTAAEIAPRSPSLTVVLNEELSSSGLEMAPETARATTPLRPGGAIRGRSPESALMASSNALPARSASSSVWRMSSSSLLRHSTYFFRASLNRSKWYSKPFSIEVEGAATAPSDETPKWHLLHLSCPS